MMQHGLQGSATSNIGLGLGGSLTAGRQEPSLSEHVQRLENLGHRVQEIFSRADGLADKFDAAPHAALAPNALNSAAASNAPESTGLVQRMSRRLNVLEASLGNIEAALARIERAHG